MEKSFASQPRTCFSISWFSKHFRTFNFLHFWLRNVFRTTTTYIFSIFQILKLFRSWILYIDLEIYFAIQGHALFRHFNFQEWSEIAVFYALWFGNMLRVTTVCTFSTSQIPKVLRTWCALYILTWKYCSCHNGAHFFLRSQLPKVLRTAQHFLHFWFRNLLCGTTVRV